MALRDVALLRGSNVGQARRVGMAELRAFLEELGYRDVRTVLSSGNALLTAPGLSPDQAAAHIQQAMAERLGFETRVIVLTSAEVAAAVEDNPLLDVAADRSRLYLAVMADPANRVQLRPLLAQNWAPEELAVGARVAYLWCPQGVIASRLPAAVDRALGDAVTLRSWNTMVKLATAAAT